MKAIHHVVGASCLVLTFTAANLRAQKCRDQIFQSEPETNC
jgi:hypothetical protein